MNESTTTPARVVVVGAGFAGLEVVRTLRDVDCSITLIDRNNYHLFQPLLYQVATAGLSPEQIAYPVRAIFRRQRNLRFRMAEVERVDLEARRVITGAGTHAYDYLVLAAGARTEFFGLDQARTHGFELKGLDDAIAIRNHALRCLERAAVENDPERRRAWLTFVVVGGGPTGVEMAGAFSELIRVALKREFPGIEPDELQVVLLEATSHLLGAMPEPLPEAARRALAARGVRVLSDCRLTAYDGRLAQLSAGPELPAATLVWAAGVAANPILDPEQAERGRQDRVRVDACLALPGRPEVFVAGDAALPDCGAPPPMMAPVAIQTGRTAAENIRRSIAGRPRIEFRYKDPGSLATIGRNAAVASIRGWRFKGRLAWWVWLFVHLVMLIGFRNRLVVLIHWAWEYVFYERAVRLITRSGR